MDAIKKNRGIEPRKIAFPKTFYTIVVVPTDQSYRPDIIEVNPGQFQKEGALGGKRPVTDSKWIQTTTYKTCRV